MIALVYCLEGVSKATGKKKETKESIWSPQVVETEMGIQGGQEDWHSQDRIQGRENWSSELETESIPLSH